MYIKSVKIYGFGKHINRELNFKSGLNVIYGENEAGKTTVFAFIRAMLYGLTGRGSENYRKKYMPWERVDSQGKGVRFGGELVFESEGTVYHEICLWGASKREDVCTLNEFYTGRAVKLFPNKTVGEQILKLSAEAFDSSVYIGQLGSVIKQGGDKDGVLLARLSAVSGFDDEEKTGTAVRRLLKEKMEELKAPRGKNGVLDQLVIKKLNMQNELTRLSDVDNKVAAEKQKLDELHKKRDALLKSAADYERLLKMSRAGKLLITKDKVMAVFSSVDSICEELDACKIIAEKNQKNRSVSFWRVLSCILIAVGIVMIAAGAVLSPAQVPVKTILFAVGGIFLVAALCVLLSAKKKGGNTDVSQRIEELEETLAQKEVLIQSYLDGETLESMSEKWREAEQILKTSTDDERRYSTSKPSAYFEASLGEIRKQLEPILEKIGYIQSGIDGLRATSNVSFAEASDALCGIDAEIEKQNELYKAYELAAAALDDSMEEIRTTLCPKLCDDTERIIAQITEKHIHVKIDDDFTISVYDDSIPRNINSYSGATVDQAYFALRVAIAGTISPKGEPYPIMLDDSFVQYDDSRMLNGFDFLKKYAKSEENSNQIIFATCHERVKSAAEGVSCITEL